jgi:gamma-glutamyltranspeptidase/glutathione hydrolase
VVSANRLASKSGTNILKKGGNAVDAAITTAHMLGVAVPAFSGVGGGGFALIWLAREEKPVFVDFREKAPLAATEDMYKLTPSGEVRREENAVGYRAVAVPGAISGHASILEKYGSLGLKETLEAAARTARHGFSVDRALAYTWRLGAKKLRKFSESKSTYLKQGHPYRAGDRVSLPTLARTLTSLAREGAEELYTGSLAHRIARDMAANRGLITTGDLEAYEPTAREPLRGSYKEYEIITAPPPSAGGAIILQSLNILEHFPLKGYRSLSAQGLHFLAEAFARAAINCRSTISDPALCSPPMETLLSKTFGNELASSISANSSSIPTNSGGFPLAPASNTTHLVAIDSERNVVSLTESIECYFGSGVIVPGTGFILNDTMHDFEPRPGMTNSVGPGKIPMSSMSPTIVLKDGRPVLAVGAAGGPRIASATLQVLLNVLEYGLELPDAVAAPRIHVNGTLLQMEPTVGGAVARELRKMGHSVQVKKNARKTDPPLYFGGVQAAQIMNDNSLNGAPDPRRDGTAAGLR